MDFDWLMRGYYQVDKYVFFDKESNNHFLRFLKLAIFYALAIIYSIRLLK